MTLLVCFYKPYLFIHDFMRHIIILEDRYYLLLGVECCGRQIPGGTKKISS